MRLLRRERLVVTLVLLSFLICMIIAIAFVSDLDILGSRKSRGISEPDDPKFDALGESDPFQRSPLPNVSNLNNNMESDQERPDNKQQIARDSANANEVSNGTDTPNYNVHVFYYVWYGNPATDGGYLHWNHRFLPHWKQEITDRHPKGRHQPPDDIGASFFPRLGAYSSKDPSVIDDHMRQIRKSGAGVLAVSWYPRGLADDEGRNIDEAIPLVLDAADKYSLKVCFHIEPYKDRNHVTLRGNLSYIIQQYSSHPAFYRRPDSNLPLYYIYDSYLVSDEHWRSLLRSDGPTTVRKTPLDGIFLGLAVEQRHPDRLIGCGFDGFYTYFASEHFTYGSTSQHWPAMAAAALREGVLFVPSVGPGYDDVRIRPWNAENTRERLNGDYYERNFAAAVRTLPDAISITSFNEWHEGTQIEEAVPKKTNDGSFAYMDYSPNDADYYLLLTRKWVNNFSKMKSQEQFN